MSYMNLRITRQWVRIRSRMIRGVKTGPQPTRTIWNADVVTAERKRHRNIWRGVHCAGTANERRELEDWKKWHPGNDDKAH